MALNKVQRKALTEEMAKRKYVETMERIRVHVDEKNKFQNLQRFMNLQRREMEEEDKIAKTKEPIAIQQAHIEQEEKLAEELGKLRREELNEMKRRQLLRENSHELRELETKLRAAYVNKELKAQMAEKEAAKRMRTINEKKANELWQQAWIKDEEFKQQVAQKEIHEKAKYKLELQNQMIFKEQSKRFEYEEFMREKKMLDDIIQRLHDEDERAIEEKMCKMKKTRLEIDAFKAAQQVWKNKKKLEIVDENRRIQEYLLSRASDAKARRDEKARKEAIKAKISEDIAKKIYAKENERREREQIIFDLMEAEEGEKIQLRHQQEVEKEIRQKLEVHDSLTRQMAERQEELRKEAERDAAYKEQLIAKVAEDERVEQLSNEKKRLKMVEVRKYVQQMIVDRRQKRAEEMQLLMKLYEDDQKQLEQKRLVIEEERMRILKEHVHNLIGYIPRGVLKPEDLPQIGTEIFGKQVPANYDE